MRLTPILRIVYPRMRRTPGLKYAGKNQRVLPVKTSGKEKAVNYMMMEEQNTKYLNNHYMTNAEEVTYGKDHPERKIERHIKFLESKKRPFFPNRTIEDIYNSTLGTHRKWE